jgi:ferredoxin-type protein NapH
VRVAHFALSLGVVGLLVRAGYDHGFTWRATDGLWWFLGGCCLYYLIGIGLAFALEDNRAFCKYACPVTVFLRAGNRLAVLKVKGALESCTECGACDKVCPMDVPVLEFVRTGTRFLDPECTLCQSCIGACPEGSLQLSLGFDVSSGRRIAVGEDAPKGRVA